MNINQEWNLAHWYLVHTHPKQELRAEANLRTLPLETFLPRRRVERLNRFTDKKEHLVTPLFPRYLFVRFKVSDLYHRVCFTRGVQGVVSFDGTPTLVEDDIVIMIQSRQGNDGLVKVCENFTKGDQVLIKEGPFKNLVAVFEHAASDAERVMLLLQTVTYQGHLVMDRINIVKMGSRDSFAGQ